ncbi:hypothetical protein HOD96_04005 [Candidatus Falkowbacteria bacterium]|jgi:hypothetical protein|nr:hypothetical protein [Candidatus Falkowbacteria bacterium]MBT4433547.1 hypothetical protein [Candidatus Falkowbacteria bacterium]
MNNLIEFPSIENSTEILKKAVDEIKKGIDKKLKEDFEDSSEQDEEFKIADRRYFHDRQHTKDVVEIYKEISKIFVESGDMNERTQQIGLLKACAHDVVQGYELNNEGVRKRHIVTNEQLSADYAKDEMKKYNVFTVKEVKSMDGINVTVPGFKDNKLYQPNLADETPLDDRILAWSDLGMIGCDSEKFIAEGHRLFWEDNSDITKEIIESEKLDEIDNKKKDNYTKRMRNFLFFQVGFIDNRKQHMEEQYKLLSKTIPEKVLEKLKSQIFDKFDKSKKLAKEQYEKAESSSFEDLCKIMECQTILQ